MVEHDESLFDVAGLVALVTGASSGLGHHFCRTLAARGASVVGVAQRVDRLDALVSEQSGIVARPCDLRSPDAVGELMASVDGDFGRVDVVVNNAGMTDAVVRATEESPELFRDVLDVNLVSERERGAGHTVNRTCSRPRRLGSGPERNASQWPICG